MTPTEDDSSDEDGKSGALSAAERRSVTAWSLPLLASYFATGIDSLIPQQAIGTSADDQLDELAELVRIRVLLAAAEELEPLLRRVLVRPAFQYQRVDDESVGVIRGRLDTVKFLRQRHEVSAPRRFPVIETRRNHDLPENRLCVAAAMVLLQQIAGLPFDRLPESTIERRRIEKATAALRRLARSASFAPAHESASQVIRKGRLAGVLDTARRRLEAGHVSNASAYAAVADWVETFDIEGACASQGDLTWLFYDSRFDTRLFELWSLKHLLEATERKLGLPSATRLLLERSEGPVATWTMASMSIEIWFQAGLSRLDIGGPTWTYCELDHEATVKPFGGIPDITLVIEDQAGNRRPVFCDPKLRQRNQIPSSEMYKLLGYFGNVPDRHPKQGAIIFHGPGAERVYQLRSHNDGEMLAIAADPLDDAGTSAQFDLLVDLATRVIPPSLLHRARGPASPSDEASTEQWVDECQRSAVNEMAETIDATSLDRSMKSLRSNLIAVWDQIDPDTRRMLATAEHFGASATSEMDHSGPLLGLAASCERLLRNYVESKGVVLDSKSTLGRLLRSYRDAVGTNPRYEAKVVRRALAEDHVDFGTIRQLADDLFVLNSRYRIPAAHAEILEENQWLKGRAAVLVGPDALLPRILDTLFTPEGQQGATQQPNTEKLQADG